MIITFRQLKAIRKKHSQEKIVCAGGTFDLMHEGHVTAIQNLSKFGTIIVMCISSDKRVQQRKGKERPILSEKHRAFLVDSVKGVDYTVIMPEPSIKHPYPTIQIINSLFPDYFVSIDKKWKLFKEKIEENKITKLKIVKRAKVFSTTKIIETIFQKYA